MRHATVVPLVGQFGFRRRQPAFELAVAGLVRPQLLAQRVIGLGRIVRVVVGHGGRLHAIRALGLVVDPLGERGLFLAQLLLRGRTAGGGCAWGGDCRASVGGRLFERLLLGLFGLHQFHHKLHRGRFHERLHDQIGVFGRDRHRGVLPFLGIGYGRRGFRGIALGILRLLAGHLPRGGHARRAGECRSRAVLGQQRRAGIPGNEFAVVLGIVDAHVEGRRIGSQGGDRVQDALFHRPTEIDLGGPAGHLARQVRLVAEPVFLREDRPLRILVADHPETERAGEAQHAGLRLVASLAGRVLVGDRGEIAGIGDPVIHVVADRPQGFEVVLLDREDRVAIVVQLRLPVGIAQYAGVFVLLEDRHVLDVCELVVSELLVGLSFAVRFPLRLPPGLEHNGVALFGVREFVGQNLVRASDEIRFGFAGLRLGDWHGWKRKKPAARH